MQWEVAGFGPDIDAPESKKREWFRNIEQYYLTFGYGEMREATVERAATLKTLSTPLAASFVVVPGYYDEEQRPMYYIACVKCEDSDLMRVFQPGSQGILCWDVPLETIKPEGWRWQSKPALPNIDAYGNILLLLTRPQDGIYLHTMPEVAPYPSENMSDHSLEEVWLFPSTNDMSGRRLVDCARKVGLEPGERFDNLHQTLLGRNLPVQEERNVMNDALSAMSHDDETDATKKISDLYRDLQPDQLAVVKQILGGQRFISMVQG